ncbi:MAG: hypothetical protein IPK39_20735 [Sulfuritalea sp.]|nr:hypothetical protein [Sulfuritalea sp.]
MTLPTSTTIRKGRPTFLGGQGAGVVLGLAAGAQQGVVEDTADSFRQPGLLGFEDVAGAAEAVAEAI